MAWIVSIVRFAKVRRPRHNTNNRGNASPISKLRWHAKKEMWLRGVDHPDKIVSSLIFRLAPTSQQVRIAVSASSSNSGDAESVRRLRRQVEHAIEQLAALSGSNLPPGEFYSELLRKGLSGIDAPAGAVWLKTPQGVLQPQCQQNISNVGLDDLPEGRTAHNQLLKFAFEKGKPGILGPKQRAEGDRSAGNPTDYSLALAPILNEDNQTLGVVEIFQQPNWNPQDLVMYTIHMAGYASNFLRNTSNRKVAVQEQIWTQLEVYSRQVHSSLNPTEVAYTVANEGRRLVGCDRISVGIRHGKKVTIEAVSGADVVEKASAHIRRMRALFDSVIEWGEKLTYRGQRDDTLPPKVLIALDEYLMEQTPKLLVLLPIRDEREKPKEKELAKPVRSALLMEVFDPPESVAVIEQKLEVLGAHSVGALYNASEMKQVPLKPLWFPLMKVQQGLGGKARFWLYFSVITLFLLTVALCTIPYQLKVDATGKLAPLERQYVFAPTDGIVRRFLVVPNQEVTPGQPLAVMDKIEWGKEITALQGQYRGLTQQIDQLNKSVEGLSASEREQRRSEKVKYEIERRKVEDDLRIYEAVHKCDLNFPGQFNVLAPETRPSQTQGRPLWSVITPDFKEELTGKMLRPGEQLMRVGHTAPKAGWELVLKIPQKHVGKLMKGFNENPEKDDVGEFLWVDLITKSEPTPSAMGKGKLYRRDVSAEAIPDRDDQNEPQPVVFAKVRINTPDIEEKYHVSRHLLVTDVEASARIRCGSHAIGYSLFYGIWEFLYERVIFFF